MVNSGKSLVKIWNRKLWNNSGKTGKLGKFWENRVLGLPFQPGFKKFRVQTTKKTHFGAISGPFKIHFSYISSLFQTNFPGPFRFIFYHVMSNIDEFRLFWVIPERLFMNIILGKEWIELRKKLEKVCKFGFLQKFDAGVLSSCRDSVKRVVSLRKSG